MIYDVNYFLAKFRAADNWCTGMFSDGDGNKCTAGHCGIRRHSDFCDNQETAALHGLLLNLKLTYEGAVLTGSYAENQTIIGINDGHFLEYQQTTPKQRILAALEDIKRMTDGDVGRTVPADRYPHQAKEIASLPIIEERSDAVGSRKGVEQVK